MAKVLLCALLDDGGRTLFLEKTEGEMTRYCLPCAMVGEQDNPVEALKKIIAAQTGIDAQVSMIALSGRHNTGSRRRKQWAGALAFKCSAKKFHCNAPCKWMKLSDALKQKLSRECEWLKTASR